MRPRHKAAENAVGQYVAKARSKQASMRPRHKAAENCECGILWYTTEIRFNEAAA